MNKIYFYMFFKRKRCKLLVYFILAFGLFFISCYDDLGEINIEKKEITITDIPAIYNGKKILIYLTNNSPTYGFFVPQGEGRITGTSITVSIKTGGVGGGGDFIEANDWTGFGSYNIFFYTPSDQKDWFYLNSVSEKFGLIDEKYIITDTNSIISFSKFKKIPN